LKLLKNDNIVMEMSPTQFVVLIILGVTIMTLIVLLIIILLAYFIYCHHSEDIREHNVLQITSIDTMDGEKNLKSNSEKYDSLLVSSAIHGSDPCPSTSSDTTCTSLQSDSSQSSGSSSNSS